MFRLNRKNTKRMIAAACLLVLFGFTSLYITYQNGTDLNAAHASSEEPDCTGPLIAHTIAAMQELVACKGAEYGANSRECIEAKAYADRVRKANPIPPGC